jgi:uncharacterized protein YbaP (TraB family)
VPIWDSLGFSFKRGLDKYLLENFLSSEKQVASIEDSEEVLRFFDLLSRDEQERMLVSGIESIEQITNQIFGLHRAWKFGSENLVMRATLKAMHGMIANHIDEK